MQIHITVDDAGVRAALGRLARKLSDLTPAMRGIGEIARTSVERNFEMGGRPKKWPLSNRVKKHGGQTLSDTGRLRRSFTVKAYKDRAEVGTNVEYAAIHQFGGVVRVNRKSITIPARPFLLVQDEDWGNMRRYLERYIVKGNV